MIQADADAATDINDLNKLFDRIGEIEIRHNSSNANDTVAIVVGSRYAWVYSLE